MNFPYATTYGYSLASCMFSFDVSRATLPSFLANLDTAIGTYIDGCIPLTVMRCGSDNVVPAGRCTREATIILISEYARSLKLYAGRIRRACLLEYLLALD